jgi:hypothetical protein
MENRVDWIDLLGVRFWDSNDERAFNEELDAVWRRSSTAAPSRPEP